jgi:Fe-S-cluster-containing hydrogenase component 2
VCIQCGNCEPACPVTAIFTEETIPDKWKHFLQVNADWYKNRK